MPDSARVLFVSAATRFWFFPDIPGEQHESSSRFSRNLYQGLSELPCMNPEIVLPYKYINMYIVLFFAVVLFPLSLLSNNLCFSFFIDIFCVKKCFTHCLLIVMSKSFIALFHLKSGEDSQNINYQYKIILFLKTPHVLLHNIYHHLCCQYNIPDFL